MTGAPRDAPRDTIVALSSGRPPAAVAVVRVSGPGALAALAALTGGRPVEPRRLTLRALRAPQTGELLDRALVVAFPDNASATGEEAAELHLHGGAAVVGGVLDTLTLLPGVRLAEAGEFTRRAFDNGKLDLAEVEGLADLIAAETTAQRSQALALAGGALGRAAEGLRARVMDLLAEAEAELDFADDEADVAERLSRGRAAALAALIADVDALLADAGRAARLRDGLTIAVTGAPNVGKSSLVNALAMRDASIVTPVAGTTRDLIEVPLDLGGVAALLIDTAGLRDSDDPAELEGIRRARARAASADLVLHVVDAEPGEVLGQLVFNKIDLGATVPTSAFGVSALTGAGIAALRDWLVDWARATVRPGEPALLAHARHRDAFTRTRAALAEAGEAVQPVLVSESLRRAALELGRVTGRVGVEDVLDVIFSRFCIGK